jgi:hypothetical protein
MSEIDQILKGLKRRTKADDIPGTVESYLEDMCPTGCGGQIRKMKPCCGSPNGYVECERCHYKIA